MPFNNQPTQHKQVGDTPVLVASSPTALAVSDPSLAGQFLLDRQGRILEASGKICQLLGYDCDELCRFDLRSLYLDPQLLDDAGLFRAQRDTAETITSLNCQLRAKNGALLSVRLTLIADGGLVGGASGDQLLAVIHTVEDLSLALQDGQTLISHLLAWSRELQQANSYDDLLRLIQHEMRERVGYNHVWVYTYDNMYSDSIHILSIGGENKDMVKANFATIPVRGDRFLEEMVSTEVPLIIEDARTDPRTNKAIVEQLQNRTMIMIPLYFLGEKRGSLGIGTFGDAEGCRPPGKLQLDYIVGMTGHISAAIERIKFIEGMRDNQAKQLELEKKLQQSQKMQAIGQLTGGIAHDFNNILASILGFAELARASMGQSGGNAKLPVYLDEVLVAGRRARDLIAQMLAFSRGTNSEWSMINIDPIVSETVRLLRSSLPSSLELRTELAKNLPPVKSDIVKLNQIIMNLCINAKDASNSVGTVAIRTSRKVIEHGSLCISCGAPIHGDYVTLEVEDCGSGIPQDILQRIFDPFFTTKEVGKGTGMGLAMVHGIVHEHHGHILVDTQINRGTKFTLLFPVGSLDSAQLLSAKAQTAHVASAVATSTVLPRILVVDDEVTVARFLRELIQAHGYEVATETDSHEALAAFQSNPDDYQLLISDQTMPGISGVELCRQVKKIKADCPVILCTGDLGAIPDQEIEDIGIQAICSKPIDTRNLLQLVQQLTGTVPH